MAKPGRPSPGLDDYRYWQERLAGRAASGLSIDDFCDVEGVSRSTFYRSLALGDASANLLTDLAA